MTPTFAEEFKTLTALNPATDAAGRTGTYISLKNANQKAIIIVHLTQGHATPPALTPRQASAVAGTGVKDLTQNCRIWVNLDTAAGDTFTRVADAKTYTPDAALKNKIVIFEIPASSLDINNGFDCLTIVTGASNALNITSALHVVPQKYPGPASPTMLTD